MSFSFFIFFGFIQIFHLAASQTCSFSNDCLCMDVGGDKRKVMCDNLVQFPTFSKATINITTFEISGTFPSIPKNAFSNLSGRISAMSISRSGDTSIQLTIDDDSFANTGDDLFVYIVFFNFAQLTSLPNVALSKASGLSQLAFEKCNFMSIPDNSFAGLLLNSLTFINNNIQTVGDSAFKGLESSLGVLKINEMLTEVPVTALSPLLSLTSLDLSANQIAIVPSFAFASLFGLQTLVLDNNPISDSGLYNNSFWNTFSLSSVSISGCQLKTLPTNSLLAVSNTLTSLTISTNLITTIPSYAFQKFTVLQSVDISFNPVTNLGPYAFYGLQTDSFVVESLDSMTTISLDVFDGMPNAQTVGYHHFDNLLNISYIDATKLPPSLNAIMVTMNPILQSVDPSIQDWLKMSENNVLNLKGITSFDCNPSISWMYPWVFCTSNVQVFDVANSVYCSSGVELQTYLASLKQSC
jgi:Leucine-rich repeat (LRR) protein